MSYFLRRAGVTDISPVVTLLEQAAEWLCKRGYDQWKGIERSEQVRNALLRDEVWLLLASHDATEPIATVTISRKGDSDFWSPTELADSAVYLSKLAVRRDFAGREVGNLLLSWARDYAGRCGAELVRLDAWRTNTDLHRYYTDRGWQHVRTVYRPHRRAGALFELPAAPLDADRAAQLAEESPPQMATDALAAPRPVGRTGRPETGA